MARSVFFALCAFLLASVPEAFAGPGCARRLQGSESCPSQCAKRWGWPGRSMGTDRWGNVIEVTVTDFAAGSVVTKMCKLRPESASAPVASATAAVGNAASQPSIAPNPIANVTAMLSSVIPPSSVSTTIPFSSSSARNSTSTISSSSTGKPPALTAIVKPNSSASSSPSPTSSPPPPPKTTSKQPEPSPDPQPQPAPALKDDAPPAQQDGSDSTNGSRGGGNTGSAGSSSSDGDIQQYLSAHNSVRAQHGAAPLTWSDEAAAKAQQWANGCVFEHSGGSLGPFGENLAAGTGSSYNIAAAVKSWTDEVSEYNPNSPQASHFTQVVWKGSTEVGCALQYCDGIFDASFGKAMFFVCEYTPQGNIIGQFAQNVQV